MISQEELNKIIASSSLPMKQNLAFLFATAANIMLGDVDDDLHYIQSIYNTRRMELDKRCREGFNNFMNHIRKANLAFQRTMDKTMETQLDWVRIDEMRSDANEIIRLSLLYIDRAYNDLDASNEIFKFIRSLESQGLVSEKEIARFNFK